MPNQCIHCSKIYEDGAKDILEGCSQCGSKFFFYLSEEKLKKIREKRDTTVELSSSEKEQIEHDVREIVGIDEEDTAPIILDFESVKVIKPGKYVLDIANLFTRERPLIYKLEDGKYIVDLASQIKSI